MGDPYPSPFIDAQQIPAVIDCFKHGVDVYVSAPCDPLHRKFPYSPLWLRATFLPTDMGWTYWMGLALDAIFFTSPAWLPQARRPGDTIVIVLAAFSSMSVFALERGNVDIVMFLLIICAGSLLASEFSSQDSGVRPRSPRRPAQILSTNPFSAIPPRARVTFPDALHRLVQFVGCLRLAFSD